MQRLPAHPWSAALPHVRHISRRAATRVPYRQSRRLASGYATRFEGHNNRRIDGNVRSAQTVAIDLACIAIAAVNLGVTRTSGWRRAIRSDCQNVLLCSNVASRSVVAGPRLAASERARCSAGVKSWRADIPAGSARPPTAGYTTAQEEAMTHHRRTLWLREYGNRLDRHPRLDRPAGGSRRRAGVGRQHQRRHQGRAGGVPSRRDRHAAQREHQRGADRRHEPAGCVRAVVRPHRPLHAHRGAHRLLHREAGVVRDSDR